MIFAEGSAIEKIRKCFCGSDIEKIRIPSSVATICEEGFAKCRALKKVSFQDGSKLEKIENHSFS